MDHVGYCYEDYHRVKGMETVQVTPLRKLYRLLPNPNALAAFSALTLGWVAGRASGL